MILYHYCSTAAFQSIISAGTVRLHDLLLSNDSREGHWANQRFLELLEEEGASPKWLEYVHRTTHPSVWTPGAFLGLSLSAEKDDLSQWRGYADDGFGFAIGFDSDRLLGAATPLGGKLVQISYGEDGEANHLLRGMASYAVEGMTVPGLEALLPLSHENRVAFFQGDATILPNEIPGPQLEGAFGSVQMRLDDAYLHRFQVKNPAFRSESEWRLVIDVAPEPSGYASRRNTLVPFAEVKLPQSAITQVWRGPKNITPLKVVEAFLHRNTCGDLAEVCCSKATYQ